MGEHNVQQIIDEQKARVFMAALLEDLAALAAMLEEGKIESDITRIGAEQEMFLINRYFEPAPVSLEVLERANDPRLTTEIARFNLEANLTPLELTTNCFSRMEQELAELINVAREAAATQNADVLLAGILPTLQRSDLTLDNLTPGPRYQLLNRGVIGLRGGPFSIHIKGLDELHLTHDNIMMESCNTSFQIHFQTSAREFANHYNVAQAITGPVLAAAVNSPLLFGHRLWQETRVALFQHSTDERSRMQLARNQPTRVNFGDRWLDNSIIELFHDQIARFRPIMISEPEENPFLALANGRAPSLSALRMHNGTVWRWNRACYGVQNGVAHLRIENRALPSGPTVVDEIANTAFFTGLMVAMPRMFGEIAKRMAFDDAKLNFFRAARHGLDAHFHWLDNQSHSASSLILEQLLPLAREGLSSCQVAAEEIDKYLGIIDERVRSGQTGARWMKNSLNASGSSALKDATQRKLTAKILNNQKQNKPVHCWPIVDADEVDEWEHDYRTVGQFMSTDLFTVKPDDLIDLAASLMDWRHIRHVPVEDDDGRLVGVITHRGLVRAMINRARSGKSQLIVRDIMIADPITVTSSTSSLAAIEIMRSQRVGCLPVVEEGQLVGIVTSYDFLEAAAKVFQQRLGTTADSRAMKVGRA